MEENQIILCNDDCQLCKYNHKIRLQDALEEMIWVSYYYIELPEHQKKPCYKYFNNNYYL